MKCAKCNKSAVGGKIVKDEIYCATCGKTVTANLSKGK